MKTIYVYEQWSAGAPVYMGCLYAEALRGKETCSFEYSRDWRATALENGLSRAAIQTMEPAFSLCNG